MKRFHPRHFYEVGEDSEIRCSPRNVEFGGQRDWLPGIGNFSLNEAVKPFLDRVRYFVQPRRSLAYSESAPFSTKRSTRSVDRLVYLLFRCLRDLGDHCPIRRIYIVELVLSRHETAINIILD